MRRIIGFFAALFAENKWKSREFDLVEKNVLIKDTGGGRNTGYLLADFK